MDREAEVEGMIWRTLALTKKGWYWYRRRMSGSNVMDSGSV